MNCKRLVTYVLIHLLILVGLQKCDKSGSYKVHIDSLKECPDLPANTSDIKWFARYFKFNRTSHAVNVSLELPYPVDKKLSVRLHILKWSDGGWRNNFFVFEKKDICNALHTYFGKFVLNVYRKIGVKNPEKCPIEPGIYSAYNLYMPVELIDVPLFYGKFKLIVDVIRNKKRIACLTWIFTLTDKLY